MDKWYTVQLFIITNTILLTSEESDEQYASFWFCMAQINVYKNWRLRPTLT